MPKFYSWKNVNALKHLFQFYFFLLYGTITELFEQEFSEAFLFVCRYCFKMWKYVFVWWFCMHEFVTVFHTSHTKRQTNILYLIPVFVSFANTFTVIQGLFQLICEPNVQAARLNNPRA